MMKNKIFYMVLIILLCIFAKNVKALDENNIYFEELEVPQNQNLELIRNSVETSDGGFIIIKSAAVDDTVEDGCDMGFDLHGTNCYEPISYIVKYDSNEDIEWVNTTQTSKDSQLVLFDIIETKNGDYIAVGTKDFQGYILKIDKSGNTIWRKEYTFYEDLFKDMYGDELENIYSEIRKIVETNNNDFLISVISEPLGSSQVFSFKTPSYGLLKIDSDGNIINPLTYYASTKWGGSRKPAYFSDMIELENGDFICAVKEYGEIKLVKFDNDLNAIWEKTFEKNNDILADYLETINFLTKLDDGNILLYRNIYLPDWSDDDGKYHYAEYKLILTKFDEDGNIIEEKYIDKSNFINYDDIDVATDIEFIDEQEKEEWKEYQYSKINYEITNLKKTSKGKLLFIAAIKEEYTINKLFFGEINQSDGSIIWKKEYKHSDNELLMFYLFHLVETKKGNIYATGMLIDNNAPSFSSQILKIKLSYDVDISDSEYGTVTSDTDEAFADDTIKLSIEPIGGYEVEKITVTCENDPSREIEVNNNSFKMPNDNVKVLVSFKEIVLEEEKSDDNNVTDTNNDNNLTINDKEKDDNQLLPEEDNTKEENPKTIDTSSEKNPYTGDKIVVYVITFILNIFIALVLILKLRKRKKDKLLSI